MSTDRRRDVRISDFTGTTTVGDSDLLTVVQGGTNKKITHKDYKDNLGVTGTIVQDGDPTGVPVLDTQGSVNNIRNLEIGAGISGAVSAQNGIELKHNFTQATVGSPILLNPTSASPTIASLEAGDGISIVQAGDHLEISQSAIVTSSKTIVVNELSDLPTPVAGVITLLDDREYLFTNDVDLGTNRLELNNTTIKGSESTLITLTYSGTGDLFTIASKTVRVANIAIDAASGRIFNWSCVAGSHIFRCNDVSIVACDKIGTFNSTAGSVLRFTNVSPAAITTDGLEFIGDYSSFLWETSAANITAGAMFNLGTATFDSFIADTILITLGAGSNLISGAASSANINAGGIGLVERMRISGAGTPLSGVSVNDALWEFRGNDDIADTRTDGLLSMQSNATNTVIASAGTPVLIAGTWVVESTAQMTGTTGGRLTYDGGRDAKLPITASVSVAPVSGANVSVSAQVAINGTIVSNSKRTGTASSGSPTSITIPWQENLSPADFVEVFVTNEDNTTDLLVSSAVFRVN